MPRGTGAGDSAASNPNHAFATGEVVTDRFRVVRFLGSGGMGEVYEAEDLELGGRIALKTVRTERVAGYEGLIHRFRREIHLARQITDRHVCRVYDVFRHRRASGDIAFLSMELLSGETLAERLTDISRFEPAEALPIARQIAAGLTAIHARNIIHRDLKSSNVMLVSEPATGLGYRVVVTDLGLARNMASDGTTQFTSDAGVVMGTPAYMAPEQVEGKLLGVAADIYAFGTILYEMTCGRLPFIGDSAFAVAIKRLKEAPPRPRDLVPDLPVQWERVILRCLEREPSARFSSAEEVVTALESAAPIDSDGWPPTPNMPVWRVDPPDRWMVGVAAIGGILLSVLALRLPFGPKASIPTAPAFTAERLPERQNANDNEPSNTMGPRPPSVEMSALQRLAANAIARGDYEGAFQAIEEAAVQMPSDLVVEKQVDHMLSVLLRDVGRALEQRPSEDPQAAAYYRMAATERAEARRLAAGGNKLDAVRSLLGARKNLDRARSLEREPSERDTTTKGSVQDTAPQLTQAPVPTAILPQQITPTVDPYRPPAPIATRADSRLTPTVPDASLSQTDPAADDDEGVRAALQQYISAYERLDPSALRRIWPSMPSNLGGELGRARAYRLQLIDVQIDVDKDAATVTCIRRINFSPDVGREQSASLSTVIALQRGSTGWFIQEIR